MKPSELLLGLQKTKDENPAIEDVFVYKRLKGPLNKCILSNKGEN